MKRLGAIACLVVFMLSMTMSFAMAAGELKIDEVSPKDNAKDMSMDNMGFKVYFNEDVYKSQKSNKKLCKIRVLKKDRTYKTYSHQIMHTCRIL